MLMYLAEQSLIGQRKRERRLARVFQRIETDYEYILVGLPASAECGDRSMPCPIRQKCRGSQPMIVERNTAEDGLAAITADD